VALTIDIDNLKYSYHKGKNILDINGLHIKKEEKIFLYGPSGCGKTTLLGLISGILDIDKSSSSSIKILGFDFKQLNSSNKDKIRGQYIGNIFQNFNLIPYLNVRENIKLPFLLNKSLLFDLAFDVDKMINELASSLKIDKVLDNKVEELSMGQQQRVAAIRSLIISPMLILADEPTSSLDKENTNEFMQTLIKLSNKFKSTLIFVSHDNSLSEYFDRTINLAEINHA
jgi:putative ABC transport system ATP-binding protein